MRPHALCRTREGTADVAGGASSACTKEVLFGRGCVGSVMGACGGSDGLRLVPACGECLAVAQGGRAESVLTAFIVLVVCCRVSLCVVLWCACKRSMCKRVSAHSHEWLNSHEWLIHTNGRCWEGLRLRVAAPAGPRRHNGVVMLARACGGHCGAGGWCRPVHRAVGRRGGGSVNGAGDDGSEDGRA